MLDSLRILSMSWSVYRFHKTYPRLRRRQDMIEWERFYILHNILMLRINSIWFPLKCNKFVYCSKQISRLICALFAEHGSQFSPFRLRYRRKKICQQYRENYRTPCIQVVDHVLEVHHFLDGDCKLHLTRKQKCKNDKYLGNTSRKLQSTAFQSAHASVQRGCFLTEKRIPGPPFLSVVIPPLVIWAL